MPDYFAALHRALELDKEDQGSPKDILRSCTVSRTGLPCGTNHSGWNSRLGCKKRIHREKYKDVDYYRFGSHASQHQTFFCAGNIKVVPGVRTQILIILILIVSIGRDGNCEHQPYDFVGRPPLSWELLSG
jgi:hypothetical protein